jgi:membrane associated rhomboid family serine protease
MFPLRDTKPTYKYPFFTRAIIVLNVLVFLLEITAPDLDQFISKYALISSNLDFTNLLTLIPLITSQFLHAGVFHLLSNMWFINIFGDNVEEEFGKLFYPFVYLISGVFGGLSQHIFAPNSNIPMLGASGAVAGVLGAYYVFYPKHKIETLVPIGIFFTRINLPAAAILFYWFITQFFSGVGSIAVAQLGGIAFWAHVGGFVTGYLLAKLKRKLNSGDVIEEGVILN